MFPRGLDKHIEMRYHKIGNKVRKDLKVFTNFFVCRIIQLMDIGQFFWLLSQPFLYNIQRKDNVNERTTESKTCEEIMTTIYKPIEFYVENLIAQGLYILAGAPKVGKSWLSLDICLSIAKGEKVLGQPTSQGAVLYLCLEDNFRRIQNRLYDMTDEPVDNLFFSVLADSIGNGLEEQIEFFKTEHSDLKIVFIDTLQMIRNSDEPSYSSDYKELTVLKNLADNLGISIVIVHHTRKSIDRDPFNMISGSTGLSGCVDGSMVLIETKRGSRKAVMHCVGRDIENCEISLVFDNDIKNRS